MSVRVGAQACVLGAPSVVRTINKDHMVRKLARYASSGSSLWRRLGAPPPEQSYGFNLRGTTSKPRTPDASNPQIELLWVESSTR